MTAREVSYLNFCMMAMLLPCTGMKGMTDLQTGCCTSSDCHREHSQNNKVKSRAVAQTMIAGMMLLPAIVKRVDKILRWNLFG